MQPQLYDNVRETTTTTGTGAITLLGAVAPNRSYSGAGVANGDLVYYTILHRTANEREVGIGTWNTGGTITRTSSGVTSGSSGAGTLVNLSAGTKDVFLSPMAALSTNWQRYAPYPAGTKTNSFAADVNEAYEIDVSTAPTATFTADSSTDVVTFTGYTPVNGERVVVSSSGSLPGGLSAGTYWVINASSNTSKLSATRGGSAVNITSAGTGTHSAKCPLRITWPGSPSANDCFRIDLVGANDDVEITHDLQGATWGHPNAIEAFWLHTEGESLVVRWDAVKSKWRVRVDGRIASQARMRRAASQSVPASNWTQIQFDTVDVNRGSLAKQSTYLFQARRATQMEVSPYWAVSDTSVYSYVNAYKNGVQSGFSVRQDVVNPHFTETQPLLPGDQITFYVYHTSGSVSTTNTTVGYQPVMSLIEKL